MCSNARSSTSSDGPTRAATLNLSKSVRWKNKIKMKNILTIFFLLTLTLSLSAQEKENEHRGTIKVNTKGQLAKVVFDNVNYRLIGIDQYGNILDSAVVEFQMSVTIIGTYYSEATVGPTLSYKMQQLLGRCDRTSIIFFEKIKAKDKQGTIVKMPKFQYALGYTNENNE